MRPVERAVAVGSLLLTAALAGCGEVREDELATVRQGVGEPMTTSAGLSLPSWEERIFHLLINRARSDPSKQHAECSPGAYRACPWPEYSGGTCYAPTPPLVWDYQASRAARFHATFLSKAPCGLGHDTCCSLRTDVDQTGCDGDPACACVGGVASCPACNTCNNPTGFSTRLGRFGVSGQGEIAHQYYSDPIAMFHGFIDEQLGTISGCGYSSGNGHRWLILKSNGPKVGVGHFRLSGGCSSPYWVGDFAGGAITVPRLVSSAHYPKSGSTATDFTFWVSYYHPGGSMPSKAELVVAGACRPMSLEFGTAENGTFRFDGTLPSGCHPYYFQFVDSTGVRHTYPTTGSLTVSVGSTCATEYVATQQPCGGGADAGTPDAGTPDAGRPDAGRPDAGSPDGGSPDAGTLDAGEEIRPTDGGAPDGGAAVNPDAGDPALDEVLGGCGCTGAPGAPLLLSLLLLARRLRGSGTRGRSAPGRPSRA